MRPLVDGRLVLVTMWNVNIKGVLHRRAETPGRPPGFGANFLSGQTV